MPSVNVSLYVTVLHTKKSVFSLHTKKMCVKHYVQKNQREYGAKNLVVCIELQVLQSYS